MKRGLLILGICLFMALTITAQTDQTHTFPAGNAIQFPADWSARVRGDTLHLESDQVGVDITLLRDNQDTLDLTAVLMERYTWLATTPAALSPLLVNDQWAGVRYDVIQADGSQNLLLLYRVPDDWLVELFVQPTGILTPELEATILHIAASYQVSPMTIPPAPDVPLTQTLTFAFGSHVNVPATWSAAYDERLFWARLQGNQMAMVVTFHQPAILEGTTLANLLEPLTPFYNGIDPAGVEQILMGEVPAVRYRYALTDDNGRVFDNLVTLHQLPNGMLVYAEAAPIAPFTTLTPDMATVINRITASVDISDLNLPPAADVPLDQQFVFDGGEVQHPAGWRVARDREQNLLHLQGNNLSLRFFRLPPDVFQANVLPPNDLTALLELYLQDSTEVDAEQAQPIPLNGRAGIQYLYDLTFEGYGDTPFQYLELIFPLADGQLVWLRVNPIQGNQITPEMVAVVARVAESFR